MEVSKVQSEIQQQKFMPIQKSESQVEDKIEEKVEDRSPAAEILISDAKNLGDEIERLEMREKKLLDDIQSEVKPDSNDGRALTHIRNEIREKEFIANE